MQSYVCVWASIELARCIDLPVRLKMHRPLTSTHVDDDTAIGRRTCICLRSAAVRLEVSVHFAVARASRRLATKRDITRCRMMTLCRVVCLDSTRLGSSP